MSEYCEEIPYRPQKQHPSCY